MGRERGVATVADEINLDELEHSVREDGHLLLDMDDALPLIERLRRAEQVVDVARTLFDPVACQDAYFLLRTAVEEYDEEASNADHDG